MLTRSILRALCALLVGILLVSNPTEMTVLLVQIIGGLFALSGIITFIGYFTEKARASGFRPMFPVVGAGCLAFGVCLLVWPTMFVNILMYVLGVLLCLIGIGQILALVKNRYFAPLGWQLFLLPVLLIAAGVFIVVRPLEAASVPFIVLGVSYILYGAGEFLLGIRFWRCRRRYEAELSTLPDITDAEAIDITESENFNEI
ncbi:MAG: DUF308 domain-containing protein [Bacteroidaceae bacterium]|nr:DUF308 domain-containing protein [Bacteroidaceae bacterium]